MTFILIVTYEFNRMSQKQRLLKKWLEIAIKTRIRISAVTDGSDAGDTERLEELPLCSCRMEAPRVENTSHRVTRQCMATESINGEVRLVYTHVLY